MYLVIQNCFPEGIKRVMGLYSSLAKAKDAIARYEDWCISNGYTNGDHDKFYWIELSVDEDRGDW